MTKKMKFFLFAQNNSGGNFEIDEDMGIGSRVYIEAKTADEANEKAERIGIYFDGVNEERDCECCGDRWYKVYNDNDGDKKIVLSEDYSFKWHPFVYVHHADYRRGFSKISKDSVGTFFTIKKV
jgi:hypothetical protein